MRKLSKKLIILVASCFWFLAFSYAQPSADPIDDADDSVKIGRWVQDGAPIKEYPVCYQIWKCDSAQPATGESISLPKGEWGLCDNYSDVSQKNVCTRCDAPPPIEVCE